jgi:hypothetical protein
MSNATMVDNFLCLDEFNLNMLKSADIYPLPPKELKDLTAEEFDNWLLSLSSEARITFISEWINEVFNDGYGCGASNAA